MAKFKLKKQYRLPDHDYSSPAAYFVTICAKNRQAFFGDVCNKIMGLNEIGCTVARLWCEIPYHFENVQLDVWQIMPDHLHGIIFITGFRRNLINQIPTVNQIPTTVNQIPTESIQIPKNPMQMTFITLGRIIRWFKGRTSFEVRGKIDSNFEWQRRFHDRVIRNDQELGRIREYIINNPQDY